MADANDVISRDLGSVAEGPGLEGRGTPAGAGESEALEAAGEAETYWTWERMSRTRPVPLSRRKLQEEGPDTEAVDWWPDANLEGPSAAVPPPVTDRVPDSRQLPYSAVGKLFMTFGREDGWATAWAAGPRVIVTAGHCLYDHRHASRWAEKVVFVPRYGFGGTRKFAAARIHVLAGWHDARSDMYSYDVATATTQSPMTGVLPLEWVSDIGRNDAPFESIGYPYSWLSPQHDFDGEAMWRCRGGLLREQQPVVMANNMTEGCSGGPWLIRRTGRLQVGGINSYRPPGQQNGVQTPPLRRGLENLLAAA
jgi:V8-like Glu-specific endopeptidase